MFDVFFIYSFIRLLVYLFYYLFVYSFVYLLIFFFIYLFACFLYLFIYLFMNIWNKELMPLKSAQYTCRAKHINEGNEEARFSVTPSFVLCTHQTVLNTV